MYRLRPQLYGVVFEQEALLLDLDSDRYIGLDASVTEALLQVVAPQLLMDASDSTPKAPDPDLLRQLQERQFIQEINADMAEQRLSRFTQPNGFFAGRWSPAESVIADPLHGVKQNTLIQAAFMLWRVRTILRSSRMRGLNRFLEKCMHKARPRSATQHLATPVEYAEAVLRALFVMPFKVECLLGSGALAALLLRDGYNAHVCIGVRKRPFYAHAWVEHNGIVMNDAPAIQGKLGIITRFPLAEDH